MPVLVLISIPFLYCPHPPRLIILPLILDFLIFSAEFVFSLIITIELSKNFINFPNTAKSPAIDPSTALTILKAVLLIILFVIKKFGLTSICKLIENMLKNDMLPISYSSTSTTDPTIGKLVDII